MKKTATPATDSANECHWRGDRPVEEHLCDSSANDTTSERADISISEREWFLGTDTYTWRRKFSVSGNAGAGKWKEGCDWSSPDKFGLILEAARVTEGEMAEYCWGRGLFV